MAKPRTEDRHFPPRFYRHGAGYRYVPKIGKPIPLGNDLNVALLRYSRLDGEELAKAGADSETNVEVHNKSWVNPNTLIQTTQKNHRIDRFNIHDLRAAARPIYRGPGIYFLWKVQQLMYVGKSGNITHRLGTHANFKDFDAITVIACPRDQLDDLEAYYIHTMHPLLNAQDPLTGKIMAKAPTQVRAGLITSPSGQEPINIPSLPNIFPSVPDFLAGETLGNIERK